MAEAIVRKWIIDILQQRPSLVEIAVRQRAKFEGWLKFELAEYAQQQGACEVQVEAASASNSSSLCRSDVTFVLNGVRYDIELKTPNASWRMSGVANLTRPVTKNIDEIVKDGNKLRVCLGQGIIAFVLFPVPIGGKQWEKYLDRIASELYLPLSVEEHTSRVNMQVGKGHNADIIVCCFNIPKITSDLCQKQG